MTVGFIGLGKLGLPVALAVEDKGHRVIGYDVNPNVKKCLEERKIPFKEKGIQPLLDRTKIELTSIENIVTQSDIIFCAVQTPHDPRFEGSTRLPNERQDFDYSYLIAAIKTISETAKRYQRHVTLVVISTCLPGTYRRDIAPLLNGYVHYVYNPFFIAMGTVVEDFLSPEFVLIGTDGNPSGNLVSPPLKLRELYASIHDRPLLVTDYTTAEAIKVSYNTFITMKTVLANIWGELAYKLEANVDDIYRAWIMSTDRLISPKYLKAGVGDGGGCHPRDNIALSYIAEKVNLSHNIFEDLMYAREDHMDWLAQEAIDLSMKYELPLVVLGRSFKPETNIETGSPSVLMVNIIREYGHPVVHEEDIQELPVAVFVIGTRHERYASYSFPQGSVVLDPFRYIPDLKDVRVIRVGKP